LEEVIAVVATLDVDQAIEVITIVGTCWIDLRAINERPAEHW